MLKLKPVPNVSRNFLGFTLIEIMIVMVLLAILAAIIIPQASDTRQDAVIAAARMAAYDMQFAQSEAQKLDARVTVSFDTATERYTIAGPSGLLTNPATHAPCDIDPRTATGEPSLDITSAEFGGGNPSVTFSPDGEPLQGGTEVPIANGSSVVFTCGNFSRTLTITPTLGKISVTSN